MFEISNIPLYLACMILFSQYRSFDNNLFWRTVSFKFCVIHVGPLLRKQNIQAKGVYRSVIIAIVSGNTLGSLLCIYLKRIHEVLRLTSTSLRDIRDRIKYGRVL